MKLSARNKFIGKVTDVTRGAVNGIVKIELYIINYFRIY